MSETPFNKTLTVDTRFPEWDGYVTAEFKGEDGVESRKVDLIAEISNINNSLDDNEKQGTEFFNAVRRYIWVKHGIKVSATAAMKYYDDMQSLAKEINDFFYPTPDSPITTEPESTSETSPPDSSESSPAS